MDWTDEQRATLRAGREAGKSYNTIAKELGCSKSAAIGMGQRLGLPSANPTGARLPNTNIRYKPWDAETTAQFITAWTTRDDINRATIARMFGVSEETAKNRSVALGITRCVHQSQQPGPRREAAAAMRAKIVRHIAPPRLTIVPSAPKPVITAPLSRDGVPLVFVPRPPRACCWPMWGNREAPTHVYCDAPSDGTYCAAHRAVAYVGRVRRDTEFVFAGLRG